MKKLLFTTAFIALTGCSQAHLNNSNLALQQPPSFSYSSLNNSPNLSVKQPSILHLNDSDTLSDLAQQDSLFPSIVNKVKHGVASWYGPGFHGKKTATGEIFDMNAMTAAHKTLPIPSYARVTNLENHKSIIVRINDRGPYIGNRELDLSYAAAKNLDLDQEGLGSIEIKTISPSQALPQIQQIAAKEEKHVYLQVGSFGQQIGALKLKNKLAIYNLPEVNVRASTYKQDTLYKVQIGPINSAKQVNKLNQQLAEIGITDTQFVTEAKQTQRSRVTM